MKRNIKETLENFKKLTLANGQMNKILWDNLLEDKIKDFEKKLE